MTMKKRGFLALVLTTVTACALAGPAQPRQAAAGKLTAPLSVLESAPEAAAQAYLSTGVWAEVYRVPSKAQRAALDRLVNRGLTPPVLGLVLSGNLYAKAGGRAEVLQEHAGRLHRQGRDLVYDEACAEVPRKGDQLESGYRSEDGNLEVRIDVQLVKHYAFALPAVEGLGSDEPVELAEVNADNCSRVVESRLMYEGTLTVQRAGQRARVEHVVVQSIVQ